jgi:hypothetical protein
LQIRLGLPGWKSRFYREKFGVENYNEVGKLKTNMVTFFVLLFFIQMEFTWRPWDFDKDVLYYLLNLGSEVSGGTLLGAAILFCRRSIMELVGW